MAPVVKGRGLERCYGAPALVWVNVVRPVGALHVDPSGTPFAESELIDVTLVVITAPEVMTTSLLPA